METFSCIIAITGVGGGGLGLRMDEGFWLRSLILLQCPILLPPGVNVPTGGAARPTEGRKPVRYGTRQRGGKKQAAAAAEAANESGDANKGEETVVSKGGSCFGLSC